VGCNRDFSGKDALFERRTLFFFEKSDLGRRKSATRPKLGER